MIGKLNEEQISLLLKSQIYGRLGCYSAKKLYMVPISYAYEAPFIYGQSKEGMKIDFMRNNPKVCFQVDDIQNMGNWWSILLWAEYEELETDPLKSMAVTLLKNRLTPLPTSQSINPTYGQMDKAGMVEKATQPIVFRLKVVEQSGRFEKAV